MIDRTEALVERAFIRLLMEGCAVTLFLGMLFVWIAIFGTRV